MPFAAGLRHSLQVRRDDVPAELINGDTLTNILTRHLLAVEAMAESDMITSILLLSEDGERVAHAAAPNLPEAYCDAIDGSAIGPRAGSCGTAAYFNRPVYVSDIATDPLWDDYRHIALPHGLRSCWSTPVRDPAGAVLGTFAIYHRDIGDPTSDEVEAIAMITESVAQAILCARTAQGPRRVRRNEGLRLVSNNVSPPGAAAGGAARLRDLADELQSKADDLDRRAKQASSEEAAGMARLAAELSRQLVENLRRQIDLYSSRK